MFGLTHDIGDYLDRLASEVDRIDRQRAYRLADLVFQAWEADRWIFVFGNGGSGATASHFAEDLAINALPKTELMTSVTRRPRVLSLTDNTSWITALANDMAFDQVFLQQLKQYGRAGDLVIAISGSGNSPNVVRSRRVGQRAGLDHLRPDRLRRGPIARTRARGAARGSGGHGDGGIDPPGGTALGGGRDPRPDQSGGTLRECEDLTVMIRCETLPRTGESSRRPRKACAWEDLKDGYFRLLRMLADNAEDRAVLVWRFVVGHPCFHRELERRARRALHAAHFAPHWLDDVKQEAVLALLRRHSPRSSAWPNAAGLQFHWMALLRHISELSKGDLADRAAPTEPLDVRELPDRRMGRQACEDRLDLDAVIATLADTEREAFSLCMQGLDTNDIAELLQQSSQRIYRALRRLAVAYALLLAGERLQSAVAPIRESGGIRDKIRPLAGTYIDRATDENHNRAA